MNSNGAYGTALQLTGTISQRKRTCRFKRQCFSEILAVANQLSSADAMSFNGNDPIGLFKNGVLIDIFGNFGGTNEFENDDITEENQRLSILPLRLIWLENGMPMTLITSQI